MKRGIGALAVCSAVGLSAACGGSSTSTDLVTTNGDLVGSGTLVTETRPVAGFTAVAVSGAARLVLDQTGVESLEITAESNLMSAIRSEVVDGTLFLEIQPGVDVRTTREILYRVTASQLDALSIAGASTAEVVDVETAVLSTSIAGASSVLIVGNAPVHVVSIAGASRLDAPDLTTRDVTATVSGASFALLRVSDSLVAEASGASTVQYIGSPVVQATATGGSTVSQASP